MSIGRIKLDEDGNLVFSIKNKIKKSTDLVYIDRQLNKLTDFEGNIFYDPDVLNDLKSRIMSTDEVFELLNQDKIPKPGSLVYVRGKLMYYDITKSSISNMNLGHVVSVVESQQNYTIFTTDNNTKFEDISDDKYFIVKRNDANGIPSDVPSPFRIEVVDVNTNKLKAIKVSLDTYEIDPEGEPPDIQVDDLVIQAGSWEMLLSQPTDITSGDEEEDNTINKDYLQTQLSQIQDQIDILSSYLNALTNAGYSEDDPEYIKTNRQLEYQQALHDLYEAIINCEQCDPNDQSTWTDEVLQKQQILNDKKQQLELPPPSTKEVIIRTIEKIGLSVMGSIDIYLTGFYEDPPAVTSAGIPSYISNVSMTDVQTSHFRGTSVGIKGTNENLGPNYLLVKGSYNADVKGTSSLSFILDIAKVAGVEGQRSNYKYEAFSALFKVKERNFWDYTQGSVTWEYFVNMVPLTNDPDSANYGKYRISCEIRAYKDYHNANLGARWFATLNKFRGF